MMRILTYSWCAPNGKKIDLFRPINQEDLMAKKKKRGMKPCQIFLPPEILEKAKERAQDLGISTSEYLRELIIVGVKYGFIIPGEEPPRIEAKINKQELEELIQKILEEYERKRKKKSIWKRLFYR